MQNILSFFPEITNVTLFVLAQICMAIALCCAIYSFYCKKRTKFFIFQLSCQILYCLSYALLSSWIGVITLFIACVKSTLFLIYAKKGFKPELAELVLFESLILAVGAVTFDSIYCLLLILGNLVVIYVTWQNNIVVLTTGQILASLAVGIYNLTVANYVGTMYEFVVIGFVIVSLIKTLKNNKGKKIKEINLMN